MLPILDLGVMHCHRMHRFDDLLLLSEGAEVYAGPADGVLEHFRQLGHDCPQFHNPAEFVADLIR